MAGHQKVSGMSLALTAGSATHVDPLDGKHASNLPWPLRCSPADADRTLRLPPPLPMQLSTARSVSSCTACQCKPSAMQSGAMKPVQTNYRARNSRGKSSLDVLTPLAPPASRVARMCRRRSPDTAPRSSAYTGPAAGWTGIAVHLQTTELALDVVESCCRSFRRLCRSAPGQLLCRCRAPLSAPEAPPTAPWTVLRGARRL